MPRLEKIQGRQNVQENGTTEMEPEPLVNENSNPIEETDNEKFVKMAHDKAFEEANRVVAQFQLTNKGVKDNEDRIAIEREARLLFWRTADKVFTSELEKIKDKKK